MLHHQLLSQGLTFCVCTIHLRGGYKVGIVAILADSFRVHIQMFTLQLLLPPKFFPLKFDLHVEFLFDLPDFFITFFKHFRAPIALLGLIKSLKFLHIHFFSEKIVVIVTQKYLIFHGLHTSATLSYDCKILRSHPFVKLFTIALLDRFFDSSQVLL